jgi:hypothetical protein
MSKRAVHVNLHDKVPNGTTIQSSHTSELILCALPPEARRAHILPRLVHNSIISVGCDVIFIQDKVKVIKDGKSSMSVIRAQ